MLTVARNIREQTDAGIRSQYLQELQAIRAELAALTNETIQELNGFFVQLGEELGGLVSREYDQARAAQSVAAATNEISKLQDLSEDKTRELWAAFETSFKDRLDAVQALGASGIDRLMDTLGEDVLGREGLTRANLEEILLMKDLSADLIVDVLPDVINTVNTQIRLGVIGGISPSQMITNIEQFIPVTGSLAGASRGALLRAERIVRTEMGRIYALAEQLRGEEYESEGVEVVKVWNHSGQAVKDGARVGHVEMDGQERAIDEKFVNPLTGNELEYPRDPAAPAEEVVNCACYMTTVSKRFAELL